MILSSKPKWQPEALKGVKTIQETARESEAHPVQVSDWKKTMLEVRPPVPTRPAGTRRQIPAVAILKTQPLALWNA